MNYDILIEAGFRQGFMTKQAELLQKEAISPLAAGLLGLTAGTGLGALGYKLLSDVKKKKEPEAKEEELAAGMTPDEYYQLMLLQQHPELFYYG